MAKLGVFGALLNTRTWVIVGVVFLALYAVARFAGTDPVTAGQRARVAA